MYEEDIFGGPLGDLGFLGVLPRPLTIDQPDSYFMGLLAQGPRSFWARKRIFEDWGAAIAWRRWRRAA